jgi:hypothetical protein
MLKARGSHADNHKMGFVFSILYLLTYYLTPTTIFGELAAYHIEVILAVVLIVVSIPTLSSKSPLWKTPQSLALVGLAIASFMSIAIGAHWPGGGLPAVLLFIPNAFAYLLLCLHCNSKTKLHVIVLLLLFVCLFVIGQGALELHRGLPTGGGGAEMQQGYFLGMNNDADQWFYRLRGMGEINDPNDFAQIIVSTLPLLFVFWRRKKFVRNFLFVLVPAGILLWGDYLTHSRGSLLALLAIVIMALRRKIGTIPSLILAGGLFFGATALHFTGGRDISASAGQDRTELWGEGLQIMRGHPLFGVGYGLMPEYTDDYQTAHNSIVVCGAELGLFGLYFWSMFLLPTIKDALTLSPSSKKKEKELAIPETESTMFPVPKDKVPDKEEILRFGRLLVLSFTGFLVAGWFLSRAYVLTLFLLGGIAEVLYEMALQRGLVKRRLSMGRVLRYSAVMTVGLVLTVYVMLRIVNVTH